MRRPVGTGGRSRIVGKRILVMNVRRDCAFDGPALMEVLSTSTHEL